MKKPFDIVLYGASGYTGKLVAEYLAQNAADNLRWAIAGRNQKKLEAVRQSATDLNPAWQDLPILLCDSEDEVTVKKMVSQARVVCTTVGPYAKFGTPLVAACAAQGVDYCDLTGELLWIRQNIEQFHSQASETGARIVHCCGFDSIPSDLGTRMMQRHAYEKYGRYCHTIKHLFKSISGGFSGGTVASMLLMLEQVGNDPTARRMLANPYTLVPERTHDWSEMDQMSAQYDSDFQRWTGPFLMAAINTRIVRYSNALQNDLYGKTFHFSEKMQFPKGLRGRLMASGYSTGFGAGMALLTAEPIRHFLNNNILPQSGEGPSKEARESGYFRSIMLGKISQSNGAEAWIKGTIAGNNDPGYGETAKMLGESALCLALDDLPKRGGILTPAAAMGTPLLERLRLAGMTFTVGPW